MMRGFTLVLPVDRAFDGRAYKASTGFSQCARANRRCNSFGLEPDLAQLPRRDRDMAAEEQAGMAGRAPAHDGRAGTIEHAVMIGQESAQTRAVAGRLYDDVEWRARSVVEMHVRARDPRDAGTHRDQSAPDAVDGADVQQRDLPVLGHLRHRSFCRPAQPEWLEIADRQPEALSASTSL